jgi:hypothetical protein
MTRYILFPNQVIEIDPSKELAVDREYAIIYLLALNLKPVRIEVENGRATLIFNQDDAGEHLDNFSSGVVLPVDFHDVVMAHERWKSILSAIRDRNKR